MIRRTLALAVGLLILSVAALHAQTIDVEEIAWDEQTVVAPGLTWKQAHDTLWSQPQNVNVLKVDLRERALRLVYDPQENRPTSQKAADVEALAAVNAGFFDVREGGSVTFIKVNGTIPDADRSNWRKTATLNGALIIETNGQARIEFATDDFEAYAHNAAYTDVLVTGPVLIDNGAVAELPGVPFVEDRHPRTFFCIVDPGVVKLVTVDGRTEQAAGMSLFELADLATMLQCNEGAINLDGGGSTTMWIKDEKETGIVNRPSDNRRFDHAGERSVSNILVVF